MISAFVCRSRRRGGSGRRARRVQRGPSPRARGRRPWQVPAEGRPLSRAPGGGRQHERLAARCWPYALRWLEDQSRPSRAWNQPRAGRRATGPGAQSSEALLSGRRRRASPERRLLRPQRPRQGLARLHSASLRPGRALPRGPDGCVRGSRSPRSPRALPSPARLPPRTTALPARGAATEPRARSRCPRPPGRFPIRSHGARERKASAWPAAGEDPRCAAEEARSSALVHAGWRFRAG
jgi:hypothetical protein